MFVDDCGSKGYTIANSLRLRSSASASLSRTFAVGDRRLWTLSLWVKRGALGNQVVFACGVSTDYSLVRFNSSDQLEVADVQASATQYSAVTTAVFRDPSAWYHIVVAMDTAQATAANRLKVFVNGTQYTVGSTPPLNFQSVFNAATTHYFGGLPGVAGYGDMYDAEPIFVGGQALTPSSFGQTDANGVWVPKAYSGTYGTNGFYLKFNDGSSTTNLCLDRSGNGNNWTPSGISVSAGATYDWMTDSPTCNFAVLNSASIGADATLSNANLSIAYGSATTRNATMAGFGMSSGKWYWECTVTAAGTPAIGITTSASASDVSNYPGFSTNGWSYVSDGNKYTNATGTAYGATYTTNDVIGVAFDADAGTLTFYKNNASQGTAYSSLTSGPYFPSFGDGAGAGTWSGAVNFGQRPFTYTPPSGFKALCSANLPAVTIANPKKHFDIKTRTGTSADTSVSGIGFQPDLVWVKNQNATGWHNLYDAVRGATKALTTNGTDAEYTYNGLSAFNSGGYSITGAGGDINLNTRTYVDWLWRANGAGVTNNAGSITSTVSANTAAGFSIVTYTGTGANATVGHGLGTVPKMVIVKSRQNKVQAESWPVYHEANGNTKYQFLNGTGAAAVLSTAWNNTSPTSSVFSVGTYSGVNASTDTYVAYVFAEVPGFSRFGSYTGNGSTDGPFVHLGFKARWLLIKSSSLAEGWYLFDTARSEFNAVDDFLLPYAANAETTNDTTRAFDITANGFKMRNTQSSMNQNTATYIFAAFAENPFGGSNTAPATAR